MAVHHRGTPSPLSGRWGCCGARGGAWRRAPGEGLARARGGGRRLRRRRPAPGNRRRSGGAEAWRRRRPRPASVDRLGLSVHRRRPGRVEQGSFAKYLQVREEAFGPDRWTTRNPPTTWRCFCATGGSRRRPDARGTVGRHPLAPARPRTACCSRKASTPKPPSWVSRCLRHSTLRADGHPRAASAPERADEEYGTLCVNLAGTSHRFGKSRVGEASCAKGLAALRIEPSAPIRPMRSACSGSRRAGRRPGPLRRCGAHVRRCRPAAEDVPRRSASDLCDLPEQPGSPVPGRVATSAPPRRAINVHWRSSGSSRHLNCRSRHR